MDNENNCSGSSPARPVSLGEVAVHPQDQVAIARIALEAGTLIELDGLGPQGHPISIRGAIPIGHKVALRDIAAGGPVRRYGRVIGFAAPDIRAGERVHVHNVGVQGFERDYAFGAEHPLTGRAVSRKVGEQLLGLVRRWEDQREKNMPSHLESLSPLTYRPLSRERWLDLEVLFGPRGACEGCWCMFWRLTRTQFARQRGEANRCALRALVEAGQVPGILAYAEHQPIAWCSVGPREAYPSLDRSPVLKRVDEQPVWSVVCFYVARPYRRQGIVEPLLKAAVDYARSQGAGIVEGYPQAVWPRAWSGSAAYMGLLSAYQRAGFVEVARRSPNRPIMRRYLE